MKKILVVLAGCGAKDGAEIHESVLTLLAIDKAGAKYQCAAPNKNQKHVLNFIDDSVIDQERNIMVESARIARGNILDLAQVSMKDYDALILPGGFGVAKNLCSFAFDGADASIEPETNRIINEAYDLKKPIGAICIAPALVALALADKNPNIVLTLGTSEQANSNLKQIGVKWKSCPTSSAICDNDNLIVSSPAYMHGNSKLSELEQGISQCVKTVIELCHQKISA
jgi:enhancing lycopene biosynthesis protein 2